MYTDNILNALINVSIHCIAMQALIEINPSAMEAARFIHLISSSSSLTLQVHYIPSNHHNN